MMRRSFYAFLACSTLLPFSVLADEIAVDSTISAATVYTDRAMLTRSAKVDIPAGAHMLVFNGIPRNIDVNSLRANGAAKGKVTFGAVSYKMQAYEDFVRPKEQELNNVLQGLQDQKKTYEADKKALQLGRTFLENLGKQAVLRENEEIAKIDLNPQGWAEVTDVLSDKFSQNLKQDISLDVKIRDVDDKIRKTQNDLNQLRTGQKQTYTVSIPFESATKTTLDVDLDYQISNAGWRPVYDARLDTKTSDLELIQYGSVWQRTGEDWDGVKLTLSTAQPSRGASLPDLYPNWINLITKAPKVSRNVSSTYMMAVEEQSESMMDMAVASGASAMPVPIEARKEVSIQAAQINTDGFVGEYEITGPADVKSDGSQSKLLIGAFDISSKMQVQVKPQYDAGHAYLVAKATLKGEAPILSGQVSLFRDGAFIGQSHIPMLRPQDEAELGFGIDDNITVSRNTLKDERSEAGVITKDSVIERHFVTEIQNLHKMPVEISVLETLPVSKDERIRVEIVKNATSAGYETDLDNKKGVTRWVMTLKPEEKAKVGLGWKVSWPKGEGVSGL